MTVVAQSLIISSKRKTNLADGSMHLLQMTRTVSPQLTNWKPEFPVLVKENGTNSESLQSTKQENQIPPLKQNLTCVDTRTVCSPDRENPI